MPDQRSLLLGRLASVIDGVSDVAAQLDPPATPVRPHRHRLRAPAGAHGPLAAGDGADRHAAGRDARLPRGALPPLAAARLRAPARPARRTTASRRRCIGAGSWSGLVVIRSRCCASAPQRRAASAPARDRRRSRSPPSGRWRRQLRAGGLVPPTQISFPAGTSTVSIDGELGADVEPGTGRDPGQRGTARR